VEILFIVIGLVLIAVFGIYKLSGKKEKTFVNKRAQSDSSVTSLKVETNSTDTTIVTSQEVGELAEPISKSDDENSEITEEMAAIENRVDEILQDLSLESVDEIKEKYSEVNEFSDLSEEVKSIGCQIDEIMHGTSLESLEGFVEKLDEIDLQIENEDYAAAMEICNKLCRLGDSFEVYWRMYNIQSALSMHSEASDSLNIAFKLIDSDHPQYMMVLLKKIALAYTCGDYGTIIEDYQLFKQHESVSNYQAVMESLEGMYADSVTNFEKIKKLESEYRQEKITFDEVLEVLLDFGAASVGLALVEENESLTDIQKVEYAFNFAVINGERLAYKFAVSLYNAGHFSSLVLEYVYDFAVTKNDEPLKISIIEAYESMYQDTEQLERFKRRIARNEAALEGSI